MPKKTLIITVIIVAVIALGATAVYIVQKQEAGKVRQKGVATTPEKPVVQPEEPTTTEPIDTSDWKTYRNEKYGLEFKYPRGWLVKEGKIPAPSYGLYVYPPLLNLSVGPQINISLGARLCSEVGQRNALDNAEFLLGGKIKELSVSSFRGVIFDRGCYECYEGDPRLETAGVVMGICNSIESGCVVISMEGLKTDYENIRHFFINIFSPTVKLDQNFNTIKCISQ
jgi:hypothetical protein